MMKRFVLLTMASVLLCGCMPCGQFTMPFCQTQQNQPSEYSAIFEVTYGNETHEYLYYRGEVGESLTHWEGCRFCKERKQENIKVTSTKRPVNKPIPKPNTDIKLPTTVSTTINITLSERKDTAIISKKDTVFVDGKNKKK